ncbi:MASE1 domain-containing protein [Dyella sp. ASV21]|uniref:MASE1 domain-containing protein n=1 Tax=Dyella sp. ASV21 TaxID=2795114 RepID=UPI0018EDEE12
MATIYLAILALFRQVSIQHWFPLVGLHVAALLLVPYRYWPAIFVGDSIWLAYVSLTCLDEFGPLWAVINLIPATLYQAPVVWWFLERRKLFAKSEVSMQGLVACALVMATISTTLTIGQLQVTRLPADYVIQYGDLVARILLGNLMGILTIVPIALVLHRSLMVVDGRCVTWIRQALDSRFFLENAFLVAPVLGFLGWIGSRNADAQSAAQMVMFFPVILMALRHGWAGAAVAGAMASLGIMLLMPTRNDPATLHAEAVVAIAISTMLMVGDRLSRLDRHAKDAQQEKDRAIELALRNATLGEAQLRIAALAMDHMRDSVNQTFDTMLSRLRILQPVANDAGYRRQVSATQERIYQLTDSVSPSQLRERGLPAVLVEGTLARTLHEAGIRYWCDLRGPVSFFAQPLQLAVYRMTCEAIADALIARDASDVLVKIRCGSRYGGWLVLMIETKHQAERAQRVDWTVAHRLRFGATGLGRKAIEDRAALFRGQVRERTLHHGRRLMVSLREPYPFEPSMECANY